MIIRPLLTRFYNFCFPATCLICHDFSRSKENICRKCDVNLPYANYACHQCARPLTLEAGRIPCGACLKNPPHFDQTLALFTYKPPISHLISRLKFNHELSYAQLLSALLIRKIRYYPTSLPDLIIPVPLNKKRLQERGFNQAVEIARPLSRYFAIPMDIKGVRRKKPTVAQTRLTALQRKHNIQDAFSTTQDYSHLSIAVVDDVMTTGNTVNELSKTLKQHGAKSIHIWCCARRGE